MNRMAGWVILVVVAVLAVSMWRYATIPPSPVSPPWPAAQAPAAPPPVEPAIRYPVPAQPAAEEELPALSASDSAVMDALVGLWGERAFEQLFHPNALIRRIVATIDNLPRKKLALRLMPVRPVPGPFGTTGKGEKLSISPDNAARYATYVQLAKGIDSGKLVSVYVRFYPLFQQAYEDLGYPGAYFNDRLVEVIDHLLEAPELPPQTKLVQPKVFYKFADPDLESLSAGHKALMRVGNENAAVFKTKLREIRAELTRNPPDSREFRR
jgi:hypothetical protein